MSMKTLGVVVVTYDCADFIVDCLESVLAAARADKQPIRLCIVDNASKDNTVEAVKAWAQGQGPALSEDLPFEIAPVPKPLVLDHILDAASQSEAELGAAEITLIETGANGGFAYGVNRGVRAVMGDPAVSAVWVLNPDCAVPPGSVAAIARAAEKHPGFGLMGGRTSYLELPDLIQSDNGWVNFWTGRAGNFNLKETASSAAPVDPEKISFICGANMIASRGFVDEVGLMREDYFLYYEEVDWAVSGQKKKLAQVYDPGIEVYHRGGASIGSATTKRQATPFSTYFQYRSRMMFVRQHNAIALPVAMGFATLKAAQLMLKGQRAGAMAILRAVFHLGPPEAVTSRLSPEALQIAFGSK